MNWRPQFQLNNNCDAEPPPPVPSKMAIEDCGNDSQHYDNTLSNNNSHLTVLELVTVTSSAPALPPKPKKW